MSSLEQGKVHVNEENSQLREGQQLTDEDYNYRLVMVGRKVTEEEASARGLAFEEAHNVSS